MAGLESATMIPPMGNLKIEDDPFAGMTGAVNAAQIKPTERLKIAILGLPKSGKSWLAATAPGPIAYYDFDDRAESLGGKTAGDGSILSVKTLVDKSQKSPTAMKELEKDISNFQYRKAQGKAIPKTFVLDTVTYLKKSMENEIFKQDPNMARKIKTGAGPADYIMVGKNFDVINGIQGYMQYLITEFSSLGNLIVIFHEREEKDKERSTAEKTVYTGKVTVDPQYLANTLTLFNEVFRVEASGTPGSKDTKYTVTCKTNFEVNASTTLLIDSEEPPNIMKMLEKHKANLAKTKTT